MDIPIELLDQALTMYREEMDKIEVQDPEAINKLLSAEIKAVLPENIRDYVVVQEHPDGSHSFWLFIPGCFPISLTFIRRIPGLELKAVIVTDEETQQPWSTSSLMLAIGYARDLFLREAEINSRVIASDIGRNISV